MSDRAQNRLGHYRRLASTFGQQHHFPRLVDQLHAHGDGVAGTVALVLEMPVCDGVLDGVVVELHQQHPVTRERYSALVEGYVPAAANTHDVQVHAAGGGDLRIIGVKNSGANV